MDREPEPEPKRRRTSPRNAAPIAPTESTMPPVPPPTGSQRPSFASPTKASMERSNPEILRRRESSPKKTGNDEASGASRPTTRRSALSRPSAGEGSSQQASQSQSQDQSQDQSQSQSTASRVPDSQRSLPTRAPARSSAIGGGLAAPPRRSKSPAKQSPFPAPRPLPRPEPGEDDENIFNPFHGRALRRSIPAGVLPTDIGQSAAPPEPEPELPPTPEPLKLISSTPPSGLNTPSRKPQRRKVIGDKMQSSPLKLPPTFPGGAAEKAAPTVQQEEDAGAVASRKTFALRGIQPLDPNAEKKKERDKVLAEIRGLESDLNVVTQENERIWEAQTAGRTPSPPPNGDVIVNVLQRHALPADQQAQPDPTKTWSQAALDPMAFLRFGKPNSSLPTLAPPTTDDAQKEDLPISHHPIPMSAEEALPYLEVFTPFSFTSTIVPLPHDSDNSPLLQKHVISATSTTPPGFFSAQIEMTVNTKTLAIVHLAVPKLEPAATAELLPFIEDLVKKTPANSALKYNVSVLTWAMAEWLRVALRRAKVWYLLKRDLGSKEVLAETVARLRARRRKRKRPSRGVSGGDDEDGEEAQEAEAQGDDAVAANELLPYMAQQFLDLEVPSLQKSDEGVSRLRVVWRIEFDWTGEAQNKIGVLLGVPKKWRSADDKGRIARVSKLLDDLLQADEEPAVAVKKVVALLAGEKAS